MKRFISILLSCALLLTGCNTNDSLDHSISDKNSNKTISSEDVNSTDESSAENAFSPSSKFIYEDTTSEKYVESLGFTSLKDDAFQQYVKDTIYSELVEQLDSDGYFVENVETKFISKEFIDDLTDNSQENIYFGYTLSELDTAFSGQKYIFTLSDTKETEVVPFEEYDDTFDQVIRNVAVGTGVILICVTVSVVSAGAGVPAVSMIFAASAKSATGFALSSGVISGVSAGVVEGIQTHDFDKAVKAGSLKGSEGFMWGAVTGAIIGGASEASFVSSLKGADVTANGLTLQEAAKIQKDSSYPLDVIKQFSNMEQYKICKEAGLTAKMVNGRTALIRNIDLTYIDEATGMTNLQLMQQGKAAIDPISGLPYELHHIGQKADSTLAILTKAEHMQNGNNKIWHNLVGESEIDRGVFEKTRKEVWKALAKMMG